MGQTSGVIVADNGSRRFITGELNPLSDNTALDQLKAAGGSNVEATHTGEINTKA